MIAISFDQDWAPAFATAAVHRRMIQAGLQGTLFVTHDCPTLPDLRAQGALELGWHPNYLPGSSHGSAPPDVLATLRRIVPEGAGVRSHWLVSGTSYWDLYAGAGLSYESSDLLDGEPGLRPLVVWNGLVRLPIFFADDVQIMRGLPLERSALHLERAGLKVFCFHPLLVELNAADLEGYRALKGDLARRGRSLVHTTEADVACYRQTARAGVGDLLDRLLEHLAQDPGRCAGRLRSLAGAVRAGGWP